VVASGKLGVDSSASREWASLLTVQWAIRRHIQLSSKQRRQHKDCGTVETGDGAMGRSNDGRSGIQAQGSGSGVPSGTQVVVSG